MIFYDEHGKSFLLCGKNYSYAFYVNGAGLLNHVYYGAKITAGDLNYLVAHSADPRRRCARI